VTDPRNNLTQYEYDALNRKTVTIDALSKATATSYDAAGNVTSVKDADNNVTQYSYNALNRVTQMTDPNSSCLPLTRLTLSA
jgi:YD repeat-containing protein